MIARLEGRQIPCHIRRSPRAHTWRLEIGAGTGLQVIVPQRFDERRLGAILQARRRWILKTLDWAARLPLPLAHDGYGRGQRVLYRGMPHALEVREQPAAPASVTLYGHAIKVSVRRRDGALVRRALRRWCRQQAASLIPSRVSELAVRLGLRYGSIVIGNQRTRWGSCSRVGRLRFNWRLVLVPPAVLDYVIIHELTHLTKLNHSREFWRLVAAACPSYDTQRDWLRRHSAQLAL